VKADLPQYRMLYLTGVRYYPRVEELIAMLKATHADGVDISYAGESDGTADYYRALHEAGFYVAVWTIDYPGLARRFISYGADAITSNRAAALKGLLG
jgi:glycerophosphoryl diester phosphodiesterase